MENRWKSLIAEKIKCNSLESLQNSLVKPKICEILGRIRRFSSEFLEMPAIFPAQLSA